MVQFTLGFTGNQVSKKNCRFNKEVGQGSGVVVFDYSSNNGLTWNYLRSITFDPVSPIKKVTINLPSDSRRTATSFRWWQVDDPINKSK